MEQRFQQNKDALPNVKNLAKALLESDIPGSKPAFIWKDAVVTRQEVVKASGVIANYYGSLGVGLGSRVILLLPDSPAFVSHFLGSILAGLVPVPVSPRMTCNEIEVILDDSEAEVVVSTPSLLSQLASKYAGLERRALVQTGLEVSSIHRCENPNRRPSIKRRPAGQAPCAFWQYTSGSTGQSKAVMHGHASAFAVCDAYARQTLGLTPKDRVFSIAKMSFGYGLGNSLLFPLQIGATSILMGEQCTPEIVQHVLRLHRPTVLFGVPSFYARLLEEHQQGNHFDLTALRFCVSAGEALPPSIQEAWQATFHRPIIDGLGSTELLHIVLSNRLTDITTGSLGRPVPTCKARIVNESGVEVGTAVQGLLEIRVPFRMNGYWNKPAENREILRDGWIRTSDVCLKDAEGQFWYCGRADEVFKVKGLWVSPIEVEDTLLLNDLVADAVVSGKRKKNGFVAVLATVVPSQWPAPANLADQLKNYVEARLSAHKCPSYFKFVRELRTTETGKKLRGHLRVDV